MVCKEAILQSLKDQFYISQYLYELTTNKKLALVAVYNFKLDILFLSLQKALLKLLTTKIIHSICRNILSTCAGMALGVLACYTTVWQVLNHIWGWGLVMK